MGMEGRTDMTKLIVAFRNFAKAPKNSTFFKRTVFTYCVGSSEQRAVFPYSMLTECSVILEMECVYSAVRAERINEFQVNLII
jgi:hypothetical protein